MVVRALRPNLKEENKMSKEFIKLQLFGDPSGDPQPNDPTPPGGGDQPNDTDLAQQLADLKKKFVSKEDYDKVVKDRQTLIDAIMEGREDDLIPKPEEKVDADKIVKEILVQDNNMSDIEYMTKVLQVRDARIEAGQRDPFLQENYEERDVESANNFADNVRECIELAKGDNASFIALFNSRIKDTPMRPGSPRIR